MLRKLVQNASKARAGRAHVVEMLISVLASGPNTADKAVSSSTFFTNSVLWSSVTKPGGRSKKTVSLG